ncbi:MAG: hypothetical protein OXE77_00795 [Flavobacteriaceae bacterium]|nr:hypothetical protein [Flavobacteriaceae bacterium]MCY4268076.1 hypothetical protein [Flavobacteriaceae bacterium]
MERFSNQKQPLKVFDEKVFLRGYDQGIWPIVLKEHRKIKPVGIITRDFEKTVFQIEIKETTVMVG